MIKMDEMIAFFRKIKILKRLNIIVNHVMNEKKKFHENFNNVNIKYAEIAFNFSFNNKHIMN